VTVPRVTPGKHFTGAPDPRAPGGSPSRSGALLVTAQDRREVLLDVLFILATIVVAALVLASLVLEVP
jgi:hypothetical protein